MQSDNKRTVPLYSFLSPRRALRVIVALSVVAVAIFGPFFARRILEDPLFFNLFREETAEVPATETVTDVSAMREKLRNERTIIHAGGHIRTADGNDYTYTNSVEALNRSYDAGNRICELDFLLTKDGHLVCAHDGWDRWAMGLPFRGAPDRAEFLAEKMYGELETLDLDALLQFMRGHEDFYVVTDIKSDSLSNLKGCGIIRKYAPDLLDRFIIQIYHDEEFTRVQALGFPYLIYTLYAADADERKPEAIIKACRKYDLTGLTMPRALVNDEEFTAQIRETGVPLFVHTVNDLDAINTLTDIGVQGFYTDYIHNRYLRDYLKSRDGRDTDAAE